MELQDVSKPRSQLEPVILSLEEGLRNSGITKELLCLGLYTLVSWPESLCAPTRCKSRKGKSLAAYFCPGLGVKAFFRPWQWLVSQLLTGPRCQGSQTLKITSVAVLTAVWSHSCDQDLQFLFSSSAPALHPLPLLTLLFSGRSLSALVQLLLPLPSGRFPFLQLSWLPDPVSTSPSAPISWLPCCCCSVAGRPLGCHGFCHHHCCPFMLPDSPQPWQGQSREASRGTLQCGVRKAAWRVSALLSTPTPACKLT